MPRKPVLPQLLEKTLRSHHLVSALQLQEILSKQGKTFNKTSIYRALEKLEAEHKICKQVLDGSEAVYELREDHHDHAICTKCETVIEIPCVVKIPHEAIKNFSIDHHHMSLYGLCSICKKK